VKDFKKDHLSKDAFEITQKGGTEVPFSGKFIDHKEDGEYTCVVCGTPLFSSDTKFNSQTGWPSFYDAIPGSVNMKKDTNHGMERTEVTCSTCQAHLGHVFPDGPDPSGNRFCINSVALDFKKENNKDDQVK